MESLFVGDGFFDGLGDFVDVGFLGELADVGAVGFSVKTHFASHAALHVEGRGHFFFGEQKDLQHQVVALVGAATQAALPHQDKAGNEDRFHRNDGLQQREWYGVEVMQMGQQVELDP